MDGCLFELYNSKLQFPLSSGVHNLLGEPVPFFFKRKRGRDGTVKGVEIKMGDTIKGVRRK